MTSHHITKSHDVVLQHIKYTKALNYLISLDIWAQTFMILKQYGEHVWLKFV